MIYVNNLQSKIHKIRTTNKDAKGYNRYRIYDISVCLFIHYQTINALIFINYIICKDAKTQLISEASYFCLYALISLMLVIGIKLTVVYLSSRCHCISPMAYSNIMLSWVCPTIFVFMDATWWYIIAQLKRWNIVFWLCKTLIKIIPKHPRVRSCTLTS